MDRASASPRHTLIDASVVREINKINDQELQLGVKGSWHDEYKGMPCFGVHEQYLANSVRLRIRLCRWTVLRLDGRRCHHHHVPVRNASSPGRHCSALTQMSRFGEVIDINMPRDKETGKPKGFSFLMYEDQRSTVLAVDNMNGAQVLGRTIRVGTFHLCHHSQVGDGRAEKLIGV